MTQDSLSITTTTQTTDHVFDNRHQSLADGIILKATLLKATILKSRSLKVTSKANIMQLGLAIGLSLSLLLLSVPAHAKSFDSITSGQAPAGTPVAVVQKAVEALYYGDIHQAASYYYISDIPNFEAELAAIQPVFAQTVQSMSMSEIYYDKTGNKAVVVGTIQLTEPATNQQHSDSVLYKLVKINGDWKIVN